MLKTLLTIIVASFVGLAMAQDSTSAIGDDTASSKQGKEKADAPPAEAKDKAAKEVVLPPGFKAKKRGNHTLYCIRGKATGTRFPTESCYDEPGLRDYILKREASNREFEQNRAICSNPATCGSL
ncbi:MAG: hypothetical protein M3O07_08655 [Pseudomonadota bacterium]|nr:hypothetical protein [Pseudomonadota bacterium]